MNPREKKLVILVAVLGAILGLWQGTSAYKGKLADLDKEIDNQKKKLNEVELDRERANLGEDQWKAVGRQTISMDANEATARMRDELNELATKAGLSGSTVKILPAHNYGKTGLKVLEGKVSAEGSLKNILEYLFELSRQPYLVRCKDLELGLAKVDSGSKKGKPSVEKMTLSASLETLILPANRRVPKSELVTADLDKQKRQPQNRLALASVGEYHQSIRKELFEPYVEPPKPPPPPPPVTANDQKPPKPPPPPPPPPPDQNMVVGRILIWPGNEQVVLENPGRGQEDKRVEIGDTMYNGTLIYIHPKGAVTEQKDEKWLFHPVGSPLREHFELTADSQPEVYYKLTKLQERLKGISRVPG